MGKLARTAYARIFKVPRRTAIAGTPNAGMVGLITLLAALAAIAIAAIVPVSLFLVAQAHLRGEIEIDAQLYANRVADEARQNPVLWNALADGTADPALDSLEIARPLTSTNPAPLNDGGCFPRPVKRSSRRRLRAAGLAAGDRSPGADGGDASLGQVDMRARYGRH